MTRKIDRNVEYFKSKGGRDWGRGKILLNEYKILKRLGSGGTGEVYLVHRLGETHRMFAIKTLATSVNSNKSVRKLFFREIQTWIDLPPNPHLTECYFLKTIEDRLAIFAEYVDGGSLKEWIHDSKIEDLSRALDVAIQIAWGLQVAHAREFIHQDIKPSNILMTHDGIAKITDFGLSRTKTRGNPIMEKNPADMTNFLVTSAGYTPAYCSPEQANRDKVGFGTDLWSWGVTILEMISGELTWNYGMLAPFILERLQNQEFVKNSMSIPPSLADFLKKCFREKPEDRWTSMEEAALKLQDIYYLETGKKYPRRRSVIYQNVLKPLEEGMEECNANEIIGKAVFWMDRAHSISKILLADEEKMQIYELKTDKAKYVTSLEIYEDAEEIFSNHFPYNDMLSCEEYASFLLDKSFALQSIADLQGCIAVCNRVADTLAGQSGQSVERTLLFVKALALQGDCRSLIMQHEKSLDSYEKALQAIYHTADWSSNPEIVKRHDEISTKFAVNLWVLKRFSESLAYSNRSIEMIQNRNLNNGSELKLLLARSIINKGICHASMGNQKEEIDSFDEAIRIIEQHRLVSDSKDYAPTLASAYMNKACSLASRKEHSEAIIQYEWAIQLAEEIVARTGSAPWQKKLSNIYNNFAQSLGINGRFVEAVTCIRKAIRIIRELSRRLGDVELYPELARSHLNLAGHYQNLDRYSLAIKHINRAIYIIEHLMSKYHRQDLAGDHARYLLSKASILSVSGDCMEALALVEKAMPVLDREIKRTGSQRLKEVKKWAESKVMKRIEAKLRT